MFTICIPVYNYNSLRLINDLNKQADTLSFPIQIVVINDGSGPAFTSLYNCSFPARTRYVLLTENIGRAKIRNLFLDYCQYDYLLFLDCDDRVISSNYLADYAMQISLGGDVICGGIKYQEEVPVRNKTLHWSYETKKEGEHKKRRKKFPHQAFISNNFLIRKDVFSKIKFNETLDQYGHEDTLFGYDLYKAGFDIKYINNPVLNEDLNDNLTFLKKTEMAIQNLVAILKFNQDREFVKSVTLLRTYFRFRRIGIIYLLRPFENIVTGFCYKRLSLGSANLTYLNLYKLCLFAKFYRSRKQ
jgi:glycosyltransferase involved in cell wall biosynthesis